MRWATYYGRSGFRVVLFIAVIEFTETNAPEGCSCSEFGLITLISAGKNA